MTIVSFSFKERTKLETELERLRREIADMEAHLQHHPSSSSCKSAGRDSVSRHEAVVSLVDDCKDGNITINVRSGMLRYLCLIIHFAITAIFGVEYKCLADRFLSVDYPNNGLLEN